jgi:hypothetical protein
MNLLHIQPMARSHLKFCPVLSNEPYANVFAHAQSYASRYADFEVQREVQLSDMPQRMRDPVYIYNSVRTQMGRQVIKRRTNFSEQAAIDFIIQSSKGHIPLVNRVVTLAI